MVWNKENSQHVTARLFAARYCYGPARDDQPGQAGTDLRALMRQSRAEFGRQPDRKSTRNSDFVPPLGEFVNKLPELL